jgi:hypothetical protein
MSWVALGVAVVGGVASYQSNKKGSQAAGDASGAAIDEQRRQYDQTRQDQLPWLEAGQWALPKLQATYSGDYSGFYDSPDYLASQEQGLSFMDRSAAARGNLAGGGHSADLVKYGQGLAAQQLGNYRSGLGNLAGLGQTSAQSLGQFGANSANQIGAQYANLGNIRQSAYTQQGNNYGQMAGAIGGGLNNWYQQNRANNPGGTGWYLGNNPGRG